MRTKALLLGAAAVAAGLMTSHAQVYSANIVGYVNTPLTNGVLTIIAPSLDVDGTGTNNTISTVFPGASVGDNVYIFNGAGYNSLSYATQGHGAGATTGWFFNGALTNGYPVNPGESMFYQPAVNETNTQVGTVLQGTNLVNKYFPAGGGIGLVASQVPIAGGLTTALGYVPTVGDNVYIYNGAGYNSYSYATQGHGAGATTGWFYNGALAEPQIAVGQGFWIQPAVNTNWVQSFVQ
jgi:hypothetical protein